FLVGGASRIPLVATLLHRELGEAPVVIEQPELVVAEGSILADAALLAGEPAAPGPTAELRLPSAGRPAAVDDADTVPSAPRTPTGLRPAVDPWPDAAPPAWTPDPAATVIGSPPPPRPALAATRVFPSRPPAVRPQPPAQAPKPQA